jgi:pilus assembly protein TadC
MITLWIKEERMNIRDSVPDFLKDKTNLLSSFFLSFCN